MEINNEPREWFVYLDDRYRGPYSRAQIQHSLNQGALHRDSLIWKDGLADWQSLQGIDGFKSGIDIGISIRDRASIFEFLDRECEALAESELRGFEFTEEPAAPVTQTVAAPAAAALAQFALTEHVIEFPDETVPAANAATATAMPKLDADVFGPVAEPEGETQAEPSRKRISLPVADVLAWGAGILGAVMIASAVPSVIERHSFPKLNDIAPTRFNQLRDVANVSIARMGESADTELVPGNKEIPRFYVAANLEDGKEIAVRLEANAPTLVPPVAFKLEQKAVIQRGFAKTAPFQTIEGKSLPIGEYFVSIINEGRVVTRQAVFLGGDRDSKYQARLNESQAETKLQTEAEVEELRQLADTLERQFVETTVLIKKSGEDWTPFHKRWTAMQAQLTELAGQWGEGDLGPRFVHAELYASMRAAIKEVTALHDGQHRYRVTGRKDAQLSKQVADSRERLRDQFIELRLKLEQAVGQLRR